ncbi:T9SS type A sorting domain-containing protein [bacterium]|nr:T9SS type A sorting domain-containing protein [bacterium]
MKNILYIILSLFCASLANAQSYAGGALEVRNLGYGKFEFNLTYIKNCMSCNAQHPCHMPDSVHIKAGAQKMAVALQVVGAETSEPISCLHRKCSKCTDDNCAVDYGYTTYKLSAEADLNSMLRKGNCVIDARVIMGAPDTTLSTIERTNQPLVMPIIFNACLLKCSPKSIIHSRPICLGRDFIESQNGNVLDSLPFGKTIDKINYSFAEPQLLSGSLEYKASYSFIKPVNYLGFPKAGLKFPRGLHLDSTGGQLYFRPMKAENTFMRIRMEGYIGDKLVSVSYKDLHYEVWKCGENNIPLISGANCTKNNPDNFKLIAMIGEELCFSICANDPDVGDSLTLGYNGGIPDGHFQLIDSSSKAPKAQFCWTPTAENLSKFPYSFVVTVKDNACTPPGFSARSFMINVVEKPDFEYHIDVSDCGKVHVTTQKSTPLSISHWIYNVDDMLRVESKQADKDHSILKGLSPGKHKITIKGITPDGGYKIFNDSFVTTGQPPFSLTELEFFQCPDETLTVDIGKYVTAGAQINWELDNSSMTRRDLNRMGDTDFRIFGDLSGCKDTMILMLNTLDLFQNAVASSVGGVVPLFVTFSLDNNSDADSFKIDFGDGSILTDNYRPVVNHTYTKEGSYTVIIYGYKKGKLCSEKIIKKDYINTYSVGLEPQVERSEISIFPNPAHGTLSIISNGQKVAALKIYDMDGRMIFSTHNSNLTNIQLPAHAKGMVHLQLELENNEVQHHLLMLE